MMVLTMMAMVCYTDGEGHDYGNWVMMMMMMMMMMMTVVNALQMKCRTLKGGTGNHGKHCKT